MADDNYIDKLVGESLEGYKVPYNEAHWEAMQQLMHRQQRRRIVVWWGSVAASLVMVIGAGLLWYSLAPHTKGPEPHLTESSKTDSSLPAEHIEKQHAESEVNPGPGQESSRQSTQSDLAEDSGAKESKGIRKQHAITEVAETNIAESQAEKPGNTVPGKDRPTVAPISRETLKPSLATAYTETYTLPDFRLEPLPAHTIQSTGSMAHHYTASGHNHNPAQRKRIWLEASGTATVNVVSNVSAGYQAGMQAGIEVAPRIHTSTGLGFSQMQYNEAAAGDTVNGFIHIGTEGIFRFIELPLQVSVHSRVRPKLTTWVSAALVNLFPVREQYTMEYMPAPAYPIGTSNPHANTFETTVIKDGSPHIVFDGQMNVFSMASESSFSDYNPPSWYGMGEVTAGLGYNIAPGMELMASASYRFPLQGMGLEIQKIHAPGIQLGLRYYLQ